MAGFVRMFERSTSSQQEYILENWEYLDREKWPEKNRRDWVNKESKRDASRLISYIIGEKQEAWAHSGCEVEPDEYDEREGIDWGKGDWEL